MKVNADVYAENFRLDVEPAEVLMLTCGKLRLDVSSNYDGSVDVACIPGRGQVARCRQVGEFQMWRFSQEKPPKRKRK